MSMEADTAQSLEDDDSCNDFHRVDTPLATDPGGCSNRRAKISVVLRIIMLGPDVIGRSTQVAFVAFVIPEGSIALRAPMSKQSR